MALLVVIFVLCPQCAVGNLAAFSFTVRPRTTSVLIVFYDVCSLGLALQRKQGVALGEDHKLRSLLMFLVGTQWSGPR